MSAPDQSPPPTFNAPQTLAADGRQQSKSNGVLLASTATGAGLLCAAALIVLAKRRYRRRYHPAVDAHDLDGGNQLAVDLARTAQQV